MARFAVTVAVLLLTTATKIAIANNHHPQDADLQSQIQQVLDNYSQKTGQDYGFAAGYVGDDGVSFAAAAGAKTTISAGLMPPNAPSGRMTENDTFILGSGSKPYTAAGIMRLVDRGVLRLDDKLTDVTNEMFMAVWNTTLGEMFGGPIDNVTIANIVMMQSGISDVEEVPNWEKTALYNNSEHDPMWDLEAVASDAKSSGCSRGSIGPTCSWHFLPGTQTEYCSTNFLLGGLVLMASQPKTNWDWKTFDQRLTLGSEFVKNYPHTFFPTCGPLHTVGLSDVGNCYLYGRAMIWDQDAGIMGMGWGGTTASAWDVARFYSSLLGPHGSVVSRQGVNHMEQWRLLSYGWNKGTKRYGIGLETNNPSPQVQHWRAPPLDHLATGIGHHGGTYGFEMLGGYYPKLNASITITTNQDKYSGFIQGLSCAVIEVVAIKLNLSKGLNCTAPQPITYSCSSKIQACIPIAGTTGTTFAKCNATC